MNEPTLLGSNRDYQQFLYRQLGEAQLEEQQTRSCPYVPCYLMGSGSVLASSFLN